MFIKQISVFLDNKPGRLAQVTRIVTEANVNIRALYVADTADYGILRMIVDEPEQAYTALKKDGRTAHLTPVYAVSILDEPGGLHTILSKLGEVGANIEYLYAFAGRNEQKKAAVVVKVSNFEDSREAVQKSGLTFLSQDDIIDLCR